MSWYRETDNSKDPNYSPPKVAEQKLDAGGNYVSAAQVGPLGPDGRPLPSPQGNGSGF